MNEDHLSPQLGRLIDAVKAALAAKPSADSGGEAVAFLTASGAVFAACRSTGEEDSCDAAEEALGRCLEAGHEDIDAAAVAVEGPLETVAPCSECHKVLMDIDPQLPLVVKQQGRWVIRPVNRVPPS
jgi:hypothetical protein